MFGRFTAIPEISILHYNTLPYYVSIQVSPLVNYFPNWLNWVALHRHRNLPSSLSGTPVINFGQ